MTDLSNCVFGTRVFQTAPAPGKGDVLPSGDNLCGQTFAQAFVNGDRVYYTMHSCLSCGDDTSNHAGFGQFEVGLATWDGSSLIRDSATIEASSNGGQLVDFRGDEVLVEATVNADFLRALCSCIANLEDQLACASPVGQIMEWPWTPTPPAGWLKMDGTTNYNAATYADLRAVGGYAVTGGTFKIPNLFGGRSPLGSGVGIPNTPTSPALTPRVRGTTGGEESTVLSATDMPDHFHYMYTDEVVSTGTSVGPGDYVARSNQVLNSFAYDAVSSSPTNSNLPTVGRTSSTGTSGTADAHNTMHPFYVVDYYVWSGVC